MPVGLPAQADVFINNHKVGSILDPGNSTVHGTFTTHTIVIARASDQAGHMPSWRGSCES